MLIRNRKAVRLLLMASIIGFFSMPLLAGKLQPAIYLFIAVSFLVFWLYSVYILYILNKEQNGQEVEFNSRVSAIRKYTWGLVILIAVSVLGMHFIGYF